MILVLVKIFFNLKICQC